MIWEDNNRFTAIRHLLFGIVILCLLSLLRVASFAQIGASGITGTVTDSTGAAVPHAKITAKNEDTNVEASTISSTTGTYDIRNLIPGHYVVTAEESGFKMSVTKHVETEVDRLSTVDIKLAIGAVSESINVAATQAVQLDTESSTVGQLITAKEIENMPLNGRNWVSLNYLSPGAVVFHGSTAGQSVTAAVYPQGVVFNGLRGGNNAYYMDGAFLPGLETQDILIVPPLDALGEFRIQSSNFSAEFVGGAGGVVSASTKNGTNSFHGNLWEYLRNDVLDARTYFDSTTKPPLRRNQFGAVVGGPIVKDRVFFFGGFEGFRQTQNLTMVGDYPTAAERSGDLSDYPSPIVNPLTGQSFPNNRIPVNPVSAKYLNDWIPLPNTNVPVGQGNFRIVPSQPINYETFVERIDGTLSQKTTIFARDYYTNAVTNTPWFISGFIRPIVNTGENFATQVTQTFSPTTAGQFRFSYNRTFQDQSTDNSKGVNMLTDLGIAPGALAFSASSPDSLLAPPGINVAGYSGFGGPLFGRPRQFYSDSYFFDVLFFLTRGSHDMRMGATVDREFHNFPENIIPTGAWGYNGTFSNSPLADYLLGYPRNLTVIAGLFHQDLWRWQDALWFQDNWKFTPKLTLNLGFRWDYDERWDTHSGTLANWDISAPPTAVELFPLAKVAECPSGICSPLSPYGAHLVTNPMQLWSPRVGFAYHFRESSVLRGGYGMYWQTLTTDPFVNMSLNPPFVANYSALFQRSNVSTYNSSNPLQGTNAAGIGAFGVLPNIDDGLVQEWNLDLEQTLGANVLSIAFVGNKGTYLYGPGFTDQAPPGPGPLIPRLPITNVQVNLAGSAGDANYNALQASWNRRFVRGLSIIVAYAWQHALDNSDGTYIESQSATYQQPNNLKAERADAEFDVRNALTFSYIYELPFGRNHASLGRVGGLTNKLISGWQLQGITKMFSGAHQATVVLSYDNLNDGGIGYPDMVCDPNLGYGRSNASKIAKFFNTACFVPPAGGKVGVPNYIFGDASRHPLDNPGIVSWDIGLQKETALPKSFQLQFIAEAFNTFNHANFALPDTTFATPEFGKIFSADPGRNVQLGLNLIF